MIRTKKIVNASSAAAALLAVSALLSLPQPAVAQSDFIPSIVHSSGPILAAGGETILLCAANNLSAPPPTSVTTAPSLTTTGATINVTLQILNGVTGAVLAERLVALAPLGSTELPPDPCITFVVASTSLAAAPLNLFVVRVALNPQPLPPGLCAANSLTTSLQIFTPDTNGNPTAIRTISFEPPDPCLRFAFSASNPPVGKGQLASLYAPHLSAQH